VGQRHAGLLERDDRGVDGPGVEGDSRLGELLEVERDEGLRAAARVASHHW